MKISNTEVRVVIGDIVKCPGIDAIVNAANSSLFHGGGVWCCL